MLSRDDILQAIKDHVHHPANARELAQALRVPREDRAGFKRQLKSLASDGLLVQIRGNRYGVAEKMDLVVGRLQTNPGGFGFVVPEQADPSTRPRPASAAPKGGASPGRPFNPSASSGSSRAGSRDDKAQGRQ